MSKLLINESPLQVLPTLASRVGLNEAIILQQIHYWMQNPKFGLEKDGRKWIRNSMTEWQEDNFPFWTIAAIRRALRNLKNDGLVLECDNLNKHSYDKTRWYSIDYKVLQALDRPVKRLIKIQTKRKQAAQKRHQDERGLQNGTPMQNERGLQNGTPKTPLCNPPGYKVEPTIPKITSKTTPKTTIKGGDESLRIVWASLLQFCNQDEETAVTLWQLQEYFVEQTKLVRPDIDSKDGRNKLKDKWWPFLKVMLETAGGDLERAKEGMKTAVRELHAWKPSAIQSPKSILNKTNAILAGAQRGAVNGTPLPVYQQPAIRAGKFGL